MLRSQCLAAAVLCAAFSMIGANVPVSASDAADTGKGERLYAARCAACHGKAGAGVPGLAPPLAGSLGFAFSGRAARPYVPLVLLKGLSGPIMVNRKSFNGMMPPQGGLPDADLAALANFLKFGLNASVLRADRTPYAAGEIAVLRKQATSQAKVRGLRQQIQSAQ